MRKIIKGHLCSTETARKVAESEACTIYQNRAGFYFAFYPAQQDIALLADEQAQAELRKLPPAQAEPNGIKTLRRAAKLTQKQLADAAGIDIRNMQRYESGEFDVANMSLSVAVKISDALGVDAKKLL
nr:MAG TPA: helix-turn-helix domain protein [Caudoviricetes sp.]